MVWIICCGRRSRFYRRFSRFGFIAGVRWLVSFSRFAGGGRTSGLAGRFLIAAWGCSLVLLWVSILSFFGIACW